VTRGEISGAACASIVVMAANEPSKDDEMDLINAEFESMVSGLNLDQSSPRTYLDDLDELEREEADELNRVNRVANAKMHSERNSIQRNSIQRNSIQSIFSAIKRWWDRKDRDESDGAQL
jgi:hypothetical protein